MLEDEMILLRRRDTATIRQAAQFINKMAEQIFESGTDIDGKFPDDEFGRPDKVDYEKRLTLANGLLEILKRKA